MLQSILICFLSLILCVVKYIDRNNDYLNLGTKLLDEKDFNPMIIRNHELKV